VELYDGVHAQVRGEATVELSDNGHTDTTEDILSVADSMEGEAYSNPLTA